MADLSGFCRYVMRVEYKGELFYGWQRQAIGPTVQEEIEKTLKILLNKQIPKEILEKFTIHGSGRTDTGVHALGQVAHFDGPPGLACDKIQYGMNYYLNPKGIAVTALCLAPPHFHARFSAIKRSYRYVILNRRAPSVLCFERAWHVRYRLDRDLMHRAAQYLVGYHDFSSFRDRDCQAKNPCRTIDSFDIYEEGDCLYCDVTARSFLHHQVRIMIGTLKLIGSHRLTVDDIFDILRKKNRQYAGPTAPAHGLFYRSALYDGFTFP